jgi:NUMOD3 motif
MTRYFIYQISIPDANWKRYVGAHACSDHKCFANGMCTYMGSGLAIQRAVKKYGPENACKQHIAECETEQEMYELEAMIVDQAFVDDPDNYNMNLGGNGGTHSEETKRKIAEANKGRVWSDESKLKMSKIQKKIKTWAGRQHTEETKRKQSESMTKYYSLPENRLKTAARSHRPCSEETKAKLRIANKGSRKGLPRPEEAKQKIRETKRLNPTPSPWTGRHHSEETKRKIGESHRGKRASEETRRKLSEIATRRHRTSDVDLFAE